MCSNYIPDADNYLESHKDSARKPTGFWYKAGGYKLDIVPYTIAKIIHSVPAGFTLDWNYIWNRQDLSPAFMHEIEIVTKTTNDFICDSHGVIVTEYCKRPETWVAYRDNVRYTPSEKFLSELMPESITTEQEVASQKDQKDTNDLNYVTEIIKLGADIGRDCWKKYFKSRVGYVEQYIKTSS
ncbi:MAG: hypothetical protein ACLRSW_14705 [Christensenellaceae bacterium]